MNIICNDCNGKGTQPVLKMDSEGGYRYADETCPLCHGAGYIYKAERGPGDDLFFHGN